MIDNQKQAEASVESLETNSASSDTSTQEEIIDVEGVDTSESNVATETVVKETASPEEGLTLEDKSAEQEETIPTLKKEIVSLKEQLEGQVGNVEALKSQSMRIAADFENFRRRTLREKQEIEQQIKGNIIKELFPVIDNFERARSQIKPNNDGEMAIHKSYQGVYKQLVETLKKLGVSAMRPEGEPFDPNFHEAMLKEPTDQYPEDVVMEQIVRGYLLGEQVLRHAMVKVAAPPESLESEHVEGEEHNGDQLSPEI
jgi:molecular chaperone GrpE